MAEPVTIAEPRVVVVVLNYDGWDRTGDCLDALGCSRYPALQTVLIDNGSHDDRTGEFQARYPAARVIRNPANLGFAGGANIGIRHALAEGAAFVWLLNNDTIVEPGTLEALVRCAQQDPAIGAVGSVLIEDKASAAVQAWGGGKVNLWTGVVRHRRSPTAECDLDYINGASMLLRSSALQDVGLLDEGFFIYWEDVDLCMRLRVAGWRLAVAGDAVVRHAVSATAGRHSRWRKAQYLKSARHFLERHSPAPHAAFTVCRVVQEGLYVAGLLKAAWRRLNEVG